MWNLVKPKVTHKSNEKIPNEVGSKDVNTEQVNAVCIIICVLCIYHSKVFILKPFYALQEKLTQTLSVMSVTIYYNTNKIVCMNAMSVPKSYLNSSRNNSMGSVIFAWNVDKMSRGKGGF